MVKYAVGIDIGGTKLSTGVVSSNGCVVGKIITIPTISKRKKEFIINDIVSSVSSSLESSKIRRKDIVGIGIGCPGPLDAASGRLLNPPNLPTLHNFNLRRAIESVTGMKTVIDNDANVFVLGETCFGAGASSSIVFGVTLGTGLGSGLVFDRCIYQGATGTACEIWHSKYREGIIEDYVSGKGIRRIYGDRTGSLAPAAVEIFNLASRGNKNALLSWKEFGFHLGVLFSYAVNLIDPEIIVVGGSLSKAYRFFSKEMEKTVRINVTEVPAKKLKFRKAKLGDSAGVVGAACLLISKND